MKHLITVVLSLVAATSWAGPRVGDYAKYSYSLTDKYASQSGVIETRLTEYNAEMGAFKAIKVYTATDKAAVSSANWITSDSVYNDKSISDIFAKCETFETITTAAGTFETCRLNIENSPTVTITAWIGKVPYGVVRVVSKIILSKDDVSVQTSELVGFENGTP